MNKEFSVAMSVYRNDNPEDFKIAVYSISTHQTFMPNEIIVVVDGPIPQILEETIMELKRDIPIIKIIRLSENRGHAVARQTGLEATSSNWVALMDADDISLPDRFEKQLRFIAAYPDVAVLGGQIDEFIGNPSNMVGRREVPVTNQSIYHYFRRRCPFNQVSVILNKDAVLKAGGYQDWYCNEDYYLWIRMAEAGCKFANLPDVLVNVRVGKDMYARRGGWKYFKSEKRLQDYMLKKKMISLPLYLFNVVVRFGVQVAMPNKVRGFIFQKIFRK